MTDAAKLELQLAEMTKRHATLEKEFRSFAEWTFLAIRECGVVHHLQKEEIN